MQVIFDFLYVFLINIGQVKVNWKAKCDLLYVYLTNFDHHLLDTTTLKFCDLDLTFKVIQVQRS